MCFFNPCGRIPSNCLMTFSLSHLLDNYNVSQQERKKEVSGARIKADQYISAIWSTNICKENLIAQKQAVEHSENF